MPPTTSQDRFKALAGAVRSGTRPVEVQPQAPVHAAFVTISRQPGTITPDFAERLAERLGETDEAPWTVADRQVAERVANELGLPEDQVERPMHWITEMLYGLRTAPGHRTLTNMSIYHRVVTVVRTIATQGRAVIVGRGGVFITHDLHDGLHVRFVAPRAWRVDRLADRLKVSRDKAERELDRLDDERRQFFLEWWDKAIDDPQHFSLVINLALVDEAEAETLIADMTCARRRSGPR